MEFNFYKLQITPKGGRIVKEINVFADRKHNKTMNYFVLLGETNQLNSKYWNVTATMEDGSIESASLIYIN